MRSRATRPGRSFFLMFICSAWFAVFMAAPLVKALEPAPSARPQAKAPAQPSASTGSSSAPSALRHPSFEECDRNRDGVLDKSEAAAVPGLSANFERADLNKDGRLDPDEFEKALVLLEKQAK